MTSQRSVLLIACYVMLWCDVAQTIRIQYAFIEENSPRLVLGNVAESAELEAGEFTYTFFGQGPVNRDLFNLDPRSGDLVVRDRVDRDAVCASLPVCNISLSVSAQSTTDLRIIQVDVLVIDSNDNIPTFPERLDVVTFAEDSEVGSRVMLLTAIDPDSPSYGVQRYELRQPAGVDKFYIEVTNTTNEHYAELVLNSTLNREDQDSYTLTLVAYDGGVPARMGSIEVVVQVEDVNDHRPVFQNDTYSINLIENVLPNSYVITVTATDEDSGDNARIVYGFDQSTLDAYSTVFAIDRNTGAVTTLARLDYSQHSVYDLGLTATDTEDAVPARARLTIYVLDLNDHPPSITVNSAREGGTLSVQEEQAPGLFVGHITVVDNDGGQNGEFTCSLRNNRFNLDPFDGLLTEYKITTTTVLDREQVSRYDLTMTCWDQGEPSLTATQIITVLVEDINDHDPVFTPQRYAAAVRENALPRQHLITVVAHDPDTEARGQVSYSLIGENRDLFRINEVTGQITTNSRLDYEQQPQIDLYVKAEDGGSPRRSAIAVVNVTIENVDDEPPHFTQSTYTFSLFENNPPGYVLGNLSASDPDTPAPPREGPLGVGGSSTGFIYVLDPASNPDQLFTVDPHTGQLRVSKALDCEQRAEYRLEARAISQRSAVPQIGTAQILIMVLDRNDNSPVISYPTPGNNTLHLAASTPAGSVVTHIQATDVDHTTRQHDLLYRISAGNTQGLFAVSERSGAVHTASDVSARAGERYVLLITVYDHGDPPRRSNATLTIIIDATSGVPGGSKTGSGDDDGIMGDRNLVIVIAIACVTGVIVVVLLVGIAAVLRRRHVGATSQNGARYNYKARMVDKHVLVASGSGGGGAGSAGSSSTSSSDDPHKALDKSYDENKEVWNEDNTAWEHKYNAPTIQTMGDDRDGAIHYRSRPTPTLDLGLHDLGARDPHAGGIGGGVGAGSDVEQVSNSDSGRGSNEDVPATPRGPHQHDGPAPARPSLGQGEGQGSRGQACASPWRDEQGSLPELHPRQVMSTGDLAPGLHEGPYAGIRNGVYSSNRGGSYGDVGPPPARPPRTSSINSQQSQPSIRHHHHQHTARPDVPARSLSERSQPRRSSNREQPYYNALYGSGAGGGAKNMDHVVLREADEYAPSHV